MPTLSNPGPPFHFQGTLTETQKGSLEKWIDGRKKNFEPITTFHQVRAHQLRKSAGLLEEFYKAKGIAPSFSKEPWQPDVKGHFLPTVRDDYGPSVAVAAIKDRMQDQMAVDDDAQFRMNYIRTHIELHEDMAQEASEGSSHVDQHLADLNSCFGDPNYRGACVKDLTDTYEGGPRFRAHPLDPPTAWERQTAGQELSKS